MKNTATQMIFSLFIASNALSLGGESAWANTAPEIRKESKGSRPMTTPEFFNRLNAKTMDLVNEFYAPDAQFVDPMGEIRGVGEIRKYYERLYANVQEIRFEFGGEVKQGQEYVGFWIMHLKAEGLNSGKAISVAGNSHLRFDPKTGQAIYHRDYFDMGAFIYEQIPVLKHLIFYIKKRLAHG